MEKKKQGGRRLSDEAIDAFRGIFSENFDLIAAVRKSFLQLDLTNFDKSVIATSLTGNEILYDTLSDMFNPQLRGDEPLHQVTDMWLPLSVKEASTESVILQVKARKLLIRYMEQEVDYLFGKSTSRDMVLADLVKFEGIEDEDPFQSHVNIFARNSILQHVESQLATIYMLAGLKGETLEQTQKRLQQNSTK